MHHAAPHDFKPAGLLADAAPLAAAEVAGDVHLRRWLGEGEKARAEAQLHVAAEHLAGERVDGGLQVGERDVLVDVETFELVENAVASGADRLVAVHLAGADHPNRRLLVEHHAHLHRRGVRAEQHVPLGFAASDEEGVLHVAGRVVRRKVQAVEVVLVEFKLRAGGDAESHRGENTFHVAQHLLHRMLGAAERATSRKREVERWRGVRRGFSETAFGVSDPCLRRLLERVEQLPYARSVSGIDGFELAEQARDFSLAHREFELEGFEFFRVADFISVDLVQ